MEQQMLQYLATKLEEEENYLKEGLANGGMGKIEQYADAVGCIRGLRKAKMIIMEAAERLQKGDDEW